MMTYASIAGGAIGLCLMLILYVIHLEITIARLRSTIQTQWTTIRIYHSGTSEDGDQTEALAQAGKTYCIQHDISERDGGTTYV